ncbi:hypothetical protein D0Z00_001748 [Geotrichum galactomycetum]|uniref:Uncharacterized protein n=1 Tax=Geotrichum galactomycetum TaxID=27317 RepID=A0ACB6V697_9ASCO|nr:hypothetical protein D0Z00_001748 [Geotrichum candidum]
MNQQQSSFFSGRKKRAVTAPVLNEVVSDDKETQQIIRPLVDGFHPHTVIPTTEIVALFSTDEAPKSKNCFLLSYKSGDFEWFSSNNEADLNDWALKINFAASFNTFYVVGISGSLRKLTSKLHALKRNNSDSSTSTRVSGTTTSSVNNKRQEFSDAHLARKSNVEHKLSLIEKKIDEIQEQLNEHIRTRKSLQLLAPIQLKTREAVFSCAANLTASLKWKWLQRRKLLCYKKYFELDLEVEKELCSLLRPADAETSLANGAGDDVDDAKSIKSKESTNTVKVHEPAVSIISDHEPLKSPTTSENLSSKMSITSSSAKSAVSSEGDDTALRIVVPKRSRSHYHSRSQSQGFVSTPSRTIGHRRSHSQLIPKRSAEHHSGDDVSISSKRMPLTLRDVSRRKNQTGSNAGNNATPTTQRSTSLIRNKGDKITLMGKKFHVVEVNPEFGTSKQSKSLEDGSKEESLRTFSSADEGLAVETENLVEADRVSNFKRQDKSLENGESTETAQELPDIEKTENLLVATEPAKEVTNAAKEATELDVVDESFETPTSVVAAADLEAPFEVSTEKSDSVTERVDGPVQAIATENVNLDHLDVDSVIKPINPAQLVDLDNSNPKQLVENGKSLAHVLSTISLDGKPIDDNLTSEPKPTKDTTDATDLSHSEVDKVKNPPEVSAEPALVKPVIN